MSLGDINVYLNKRGCNPCTTCDLSAIYAEIKKLRDCCNQNPPGGGGGGNGGCAITTVNNKGCPDTNITLFTTDIPEGINFYYTNARVQAFSDPRYAFKNHTHLLQEITDFPSQIGQNGKVLMTNGIAPFWTAIPNGYSDEQAQDAVGNILADTPSVSWTYNDVGNQITLNVNQSFVKGLFSAVSPINYTNGVISLGLLAREVRFIIGTTDAPTAGITTFTLSDCSGFTITDHKLDVFRERDLLFLNVDYTYNETSGEITLTEPTIAGERFVIKAFIKSIWTSCLIGSGGSTETLDYTLPFNLA